MHTHEFVYTGRAARVVFGAGKRATIGDEVRLLGARRALVICGLEQRALGESLSAALEGASAGLFDRAAMHVPAALAREARELAGQLRADCLIAAGGGSAIGLAKAVALTSGLPVIAVPTTYAGSEMTPIYGITEEGLKRTGSDLRVLPRTVVYDPELTLSLSTALSLTSGINAIAHAAEGLYARDANPVTSLFAHEGIAALARSLPTLAREPSNLDARADALYGAWLCGSVLGSVGMALHHKLCHTLGGSFDLPHAPTHTVVLPHALAYNASAAPQAMARIADALGCDDAPAGLHALARELGVPVSLAALGMREADLDRAADLACQNAYWNPRPLERAPIRALLQRAFDGAPPALS
ncbi:maleylacetate reductase [bacterium M00.F.Ca.ET.228.01.1.1]|uniref:maleylacetate reductase n=1 Tax=Paraburkholderia phenoliruptrix TaxID=252970 RepID=UPI001092BCBF|nr:maleylacetate reductase [Paraburkholderia phenoliruptrix]TGP39750.1 maleylacetate reductase [bacterium M00.F.Ca.ET.228.01.1.1]TGR95591.1 maleylacetate reductase [bacterium M00.F.Ca.ET.191.01.1.1]TGT96579.1 maleylacetate reductase [bacterium M00.F.Ca.ET.155.01.1.1]MBW0450980.1 maleylacetate reductase [Paraburkholderia phenoliruptrix]MBW9095797.1 maleylacetate reductase [Paraburkholderia phenoliruptrix]